MPAPRPVVLWDIDGTLVHAPLVGVQAFVTAVERATGLRWTPRRMGFGGLTDPIIAMLILEDLGVADESVVPAVMTHLADAYGELADEVRAVARALPGAGAAIEALAERDVLQTVVTGNVRAAAVAKLSAAGLEAHLRLDLGGYGSDHADRAELVRLVLDRVGTAAGPDTPVAPADVWVVGDTPRDLACARANGIRCALVATGTYPADELRALDADVVVDDLMALDALVSAIAGTSRPR